MRCCCYEKIMQNVLYSRRRTIGIRAKKHGRYLIVTVSLPREIQQQQRDVPKILRNYVKISQALVQHDAEHFYIPLADGSTAYLTYKKQGNTLVIASTKVPARYRGLNLGRHLAKSALEYAKKHNMRLKVDCRFVKHFINKLAPKYRELLDE